jgi:hypothetical protein
MTSPPKVMQPKCETYHLSVSCATAEMRGSILPLASTNAKMLLTKNRDKFTFTFYYTYQNTLHNLNEGKATNSSANTKLTVLGLERLLHKKYKVNKF